MKKIKLIFKILKETKINLSLNKVKNNKRHANSKIVTKILMRLPVIQLNLSSNQVNLFSFLNNFSELRQFIMNQN